MRVAFISVHGCPMARLGQKDTGGMNVFLREAARALGRRGVCVDIFTRYHDPNDPQIVQVGDHARLIHLWAGPVDEPKVNLYRHIPDFCDSLESFVIQHNLRYDLIHSHYWLSGPVALEMRQRSTIPAVASFHTLGKVQALVRAGGAEAAQRVAVEQRIVDEADCLVVGSAQEKNELVRLYRADGLHTHVVSPGFDDKLFRPLDTVVARKALGFNGSKIALFVGRMEPIKGLDVLLKAVACLEAPRDTQVVIIGGSEDNQDTERIREAAESLGIGNQVVVLGSVPQQLLPLYYSAADVVVVPSFYETFGLVALEAMACGTPVIAARVGGLQTTVVDGQTGYLVPWHCPEPYTERLEMILNNDLLRESLGRQARAAVQGQTWDSVADKLLRAYAGVTNGAVEELSLAPCG